MAGGHKGFVVSSRPREYPLTEQQKRFKKALEFCEIKKGITRKELTDKMVNCLPAYFAKKKDQALDNNPAPEPYKGHHGDSD